MALYRIPAWQQTVSLNGTVYRAVGDGLFDITDAADIAEALHRGAFLDDGSTSLVSNAGVLRSATVTLSAADIAALDTTPVTLVPAQGEGTAVIFFGLVVQTSSGAQFDNDNGPVVEYDGVDDSVLGTDYIGAFGDPGTIGMYGAVWGGRETSENTDLVLSMEEAWPGANGVLATVTVATGGSDYAEGDTGQLETGGYTYEVTAVSGGVVTAVSVTGGSSSVDVSETGIGSLATSGIGSGLTVDFATLATPTLTATITTYYTVVPV